MISPLSEERVRKQEELIWCTTYRQRSWPEVPRVNEGWVCQKPWLENSGAIGLSVVSSSLALVCPLTR